MHVSLIQWLLGNRAPDPTVGVILELGVRDAATPKSLVAPIPELRNSEIRVRDFGISRTGSS
jgi:hypothetical protein